MNTLSLIAALSIMTAITFSQKYIPFIALSQISENKALRYLGQKLPAAVMFILVMYTIKESIHQTNAQGINLFVPSILATISTTAVHMLFRHALLSILIGILIYGITQTIFFQ